MHSSGSTVIENRLILEINQMECQIERNDRAIQQLLKKRPIAPSVQYPKTPIDEINQLTYHLLKQIV